MIDERELNAWIARLECDESSWKNYEKLAALYIIQNRLQKDDSAAVLPPMYSMAAAPEQAESTVGDYGDSDFLQAVKGTDPQKAWAIMDDLMDALLMVNRKSYDNVMRKLRRL